MDQFPCLCYCVKTTRLREAMNGPNFYILLLAGVLVNGQGVRWENQLDQPLHFNCPSRQSISYINSQHNNVYEDRVWGFECKDTFVYEPICHWSPYVNDFDQEFTFQCPKNYVLTGMNSYHSNPHEDRRWKFYCCRAISYCNLKCLWTPYINYFDEDISWHVPSQNYLVGAGSYHSNPHEDRRWRYQYCTQKAYC
ncbi:hemagglutinin/amebocyte aggregation factor [Salmo salar]|uniref:Hemagglutinin/amebocyte aggregation factor n=1 Tax=Salmo salar TaxID=8030 RepID=A0ABM3DAG8_SALSA|nr:hemagglutinin/amebocyte aggregation factor-like [Salmo salar]